MNIVKPKISRDPVYHSGYICRSKQPGLSWPPGGTANICGTGETMPEAYANWLKSLKERQERYAIFVAEGRI